ncbi:MAG: serine/threonine protein kinase [Planctomycetia bacterium]|nr:serine/threonine protein kinase [Planctomycetia bacterium]
MSSRNPDRLLDPNDPTLGWDLLLERVEALVTAWEAATDPPNLKDFLPDNPPALRRQALVELIKVDLEYRCRQPDHARRIEQYLDEFPELTEGGKLPCDLIYEEYHVRKQSGQPVDAREYFDRFPRQASELRRLLGLESAQTSTSVRGMGSVEEIDVGGSLDDFDLLTRLGRGAFATVFLARQRSMQRIVALKVSSDRGSEPQTMAALDHPNIVRVFDQRSLPDRKLRLLYMMYVPGCTLQAVVETIKNLPPAMRNGQRLLEAIDEALLNRGESPPSDSHLRSRLAAATWPQAVCWLGSRLAAALDYAHRRSVLHRDVKPANVIVAADGTPKLVDFNISYSSKVEGTSAAAYFGGSLAYMSPEQLEACSPAFPREADDLDGRSDVYSLGVVLWELLTGRRPFRDTDPSSDWTATVGKMVHQRHDGVSQEAIGQLPRDCPAGVKQILQTCLAADREERFATAGQLSRQLELSLAPHVQRLLRPRPGSMRNWVRRYPLTAMFAAGLLPNIVFSVLNLLYNIRALFTELGKSVDEVLHDPVVGLVNGVAYAVAIGMLLPLSWPVVRAVARIHRGQPQPSDRLPRLRNRALVLADWTAVVSVVEWMISGLIYPSWLMHEVPPERFPTGAVYTHFMASQLLCGLMAGTLAFFLVSFLAVRAYYPTLFQADQEDPTALDRVRSLERRTWVYFILAVIVPPLAVVVMVLVQRMEQTAKAMPPEAFAILGGVGLVNSALVFVLLRAVQKAIGALSLAVSPPGTVTLGGGESASDSFWR